MMRLLLVGALGALLAPATVAGQARLIVNGSGSIGISVEQVRFGGGGFAQREFETGDSLVLDRVRQIAVPISVVVPVGSQWRFDVTGYWTRGELTYDRVVATGTGFTALRETAVIDGISDARFRVVYKPFGDRLILTAGLNAPIGPTELTGEQVRALRVLAAPALGVHAPAVGQGPSGTAGAVYSTALGDRWALAVGGSYEVRGQFSPLAATAAGLSAIDYNPGNAARASVGVEGLVGQGKLTLTASGDFFQQDVLPDASGAPLATARLGAIVGGDVQYSAAPGGLRELVVYASERYRLPFTRDGIEVAQSGGNYLNGGVRVVAPAGRSGDLFFTVDGRWQTGLDFARTAATAGVVAGMVNVGYAFRAGAVSIQPFAKGQVGTLTSPGATGVSMTGFGGGLFVVTRF